MALAIDTIRTRLRETFGEDSQENVGKKLNITQGHVSKLLTGTQQPTLETLYHVAKLYGVSVDWLLGLSDQKFLDAEKRGRPQPSCNGRPDGKTAGESRDAT